jgi:hypothetical protein
VLSFVQSWSLWELVVVYVTCSLIFVGALIGFIPYKVNLRPAHRRRSYYAALIGTVLASGAVIAAVSLPDGGSDAKPTVSTSHIKQLPVITIQAPTAQTADGAPPTVGCVQTVTVRAKLPSDEALLFGNAKFGSENYFFVEAAATVEQPDIWTAKVYFGKSKDARSYFHLDIIVIPQTLMTYMHSIYSFQRSEGAYIASYNLPPAPARIAKIEPVIRSQSGAGCTK